MDRKPGAGPGVGAISSPSPAILGRPLLLDEGRRSNGGAKSNNMKSSLCQASGSFVACYMGGVRGSVC